MNKKIFDKYLEKEARELIADFESLHLHHSEETSMIDYDQRRQQNYYSYRRLRMPDATSDDEKKDENFVKFKSTLTNFIRAKYNDEILTKKESFIRKNYFSSSWNIGEAISYKQYLDILESSNSCFEYLLNLIRYAESLNSHIIFRIDRLSRFCSEEFYIYFKYANYTINIKKIEPKQKQYLYEGEKKHFQEIENLWLENKFENVIQECKGLLTLFLEKYRIIFLNKGFTSTQMQETEIGEVFKRITEDFDIEVMGKDLREIFNRFRNIRNKFGKREAKSSEEDRILMDKFKNCPYSNKKICTRILIDQLKVFHNLLVISPDIAKLLGDKEKNKET